MILLLIFSSLFLTINNKSYNYAEALAVGGDSDVALRCVSYDAHEKEVKLTRSCSFVRHL